MPNIEATGDALKLPRSATLKAPGGYLRFAQLLEARNGTLMALTKTGVVYQFDASEGGWLRLPMREVRRGSH